MSKDAGTPRVFLARHGETEWSANGRFTGTSEIPLTPHGELQVIGTGQKMAGPGKLIDPAKLVRIFVSPRQRAQRTLELLLPNNSTETEITNDISEWGYGKYEGLFSHEIRQGRKERGLDKERPWDIWIDGCEDGESPEQVTVRIDSLIARIREMQKDSMHGEKPADVLIIAHGHSLRAFTRRWLGYPLSFPLSVMLDPGAVGILSYQHRNINEPAMLLGMALPADK
ncbi:putative phosphoglycerate mutase [Xylona heveae TC161]|uniref:Putative phosphoglycerate mutase n=1 Tax=Xylona heveae (strain CBS 132557 / TC161) TaxID=1328760 RepID=A0A164ZVQ7_XYLHT|nr:putative phosphoglycerate mutase [Xylona heveae TC161]KZF19591.1 putative phosphoglycerate mutase [Xylona heveae TC161]